MSKLAAFFAALRYGASLTDPASWKQRQNTINALVGFLGAIFLAFKVDLNADDLKLVAGGVAVVLGLANTYLTTATSTKVGIGAPVQPDDPGP